MPKFTVIGYYAEDNQTSSDEVEAESGEEALRKVALERLGEFDQAENIYENQGLFDLVVAILQGGDAGGMTWPGDGLVEAREYLEPGWELEKGGEDGQA